MNIIVKFNVNTPGKIDDITLAGVTRIFTQENFQPQISDMFFLKDLPDDDQIALRRLDISTPKSFVVTHRSFEMENRNLVVRISNA